jgi:sialate O-acetylesterase
MRKSAITLVAGMAALGVFAEVKLATPFASSMVLQREMKVPVWGEADPGEKVRVSFAGQTLSTVADERGAWKVYLEPMKASKESRELKVNDITLKDVLVGEVWICSGQSNTEMPLSSANPHFQDINGRLTSAMANNKFIRLVHASNYQW